MLVTKRYAEYRNDFDAELTCEFCDAKQEFKSAYDDWYWWNEVVTRVSCKACGKSTKTKIILPDGVALPQSS